MLEPKAEKVLIVEPTFNSIVAFKVAGAIYILLY